MWLLVIIILNGGEQVLNDFDTFEACQLERNRIGFAMAEAYPYERDFVIVCRSGGV